MATDTLIACALALVFGVVRVLRRCTGSHCSSPTVRRRRRGPGRTYFARRRLHSGAAAL